MGSLADYELLAKIASGGMAEIWLARPKVLPGKNGGRAADVCVVKRLLPQHAANEQFVQMFTDEGRIAATLDHPNVVKTHEFGTERGAPYLAMEYLHGEDLRTILRALKAQDGRFTVEQALAVTVGMLAGLHHAHDARTKEGAPLDIVHRDVSPHNIFVTFDGTVKVVDFGIAKSRGRGWETEHGTLKGKVPYMAPEQIKSKRLDRRTDVYAVGVVLYELLARRRPYVVTATGDFAMMIAITRRDVAPLTETAPHVDKELTEIVERAMGYDVKDRFASAAEMSRALQNYVQKSNLDISAARVSDLLTTLFPAKVGDWRRVQGQAERVVAHVVQIEQERAGSEVVIGDDDVETEMRGTAAKNQAENARVSPTIRAASAVPIVLWAQEQDGVTMIALSGRIDEAFDGATFGASFRKTVVLDLRGIERITSFGVREWTQMMAAVEERAKIENVDVWLACAPEPFTTQLGLIQGFAGRASLVSIAVPFLCDACGHVFPQTLDCEHDVALFRAPEMPCPRCAGHAKLDDDPRYLAFAEPYLGKEIPDDVRAAVLSLDERARAAADVVTKRVGADETRMIVEQDVRPKFRWGRVLDGLEGKVAIEFRGDPRVSEEGARNLAFELKRLAPDVSRCEIVECPPNVAIALGPIALRAPIVLASLVFRGRCESCNAGRTGTVKAAEIALAWETKRPLSVPCRRCGAPLIVEGGQAVVDALHAEEDPELAPPSSAMATPSAREAATSSEQMSTKAPSNRTTVRTGSSKRTAAKANAAKKPFVGVAIAIAVAAGAGLGLAAIVRHGHDANATGATGAIPATTSAPSSPAVTVVTVVVPPYHYAVVASGATDDETLALARARAIAKMVAEVTAALPANVHAANDATGVDADVIANAARFDADVGSFASPERTAGHVERSGGTESISATYAITPDAFVRVVSFYAATRSFAGLTVAHALPDHHGGILVVSAADALASNVTPGARLVSLDDHPLAAPDALANIPPGTHHAVFSSRGATSQIPLTVGAASVTPHEP